jgi:hypothetical protein
MKIRRQLSFSNVAAALALFVALGGSAYAATQLPKNSVGAKQLKKHAVTPSKLTRAAEVRLRGSRGPIGNSGPRGPIGPQGPVGVRGAPGAGGEPGAPATKLFAQIKADGTINASGSPVTAEALGGGEYLVNFGRDITHCAAIVNQGGIPVFSSPGSSTGAPVGYAARAITASGTSPESNYKPGFPLSETFDVETYSATTQASSAFVIAVFC